jgi:hypothetical protein
MGRGGRHMAVAFSGWGPSGRRFILSPRLTRARLGSGLPLDFSVRDLRINPTPKHA